MKKLVMSLFLIGVLYLAALADPANISWYQSESPSVKVINFYYEPATASDTTFTFPDLGDYWALGYDRAFFDIVLCDTLQLTEADSSIDFFSQFTLWMSKELETTLTRTQKWDSVASHDTSCDATSDLTNYPRRQSLYAADSIWAYEDIQISCRWFKEAGGADQWDNDSAFVEKPLYHIRLTLLDD